MKKLLFALLIAIGCTGNSYSASEDLTEGFCTSAYNNHHLAFNALGSAAVGVGAVGLWYLAAKEDDQSLVEWLKENPKKAAAIFIVATGGTLAGLERDAIKCKLFLPKYFIVDKTVCLHLDEANSIDPEFMGSSKRCCYGMSYRNSFSQQLKSRFKLNEDIDHFLVLDSYDYAKKYQNPSES